VHHQRLLARPVLSGVPHLYRNVVPSVREQQVQRARAHLAVHLDVPGWQHCHQLVRGLRCVHRRQVFTVCLCVVHLVPYQHVEHARHVALLLRRGLHCGQQHLLAVPAWPVFVRQQRMQVVRQLEFIKLVVVETTQLVSSHSNVILARQTCGQRSGIAAERLRFIFRFKFALTF